MTSIHPQILANVLNDLLGKLRAEIAEKSDENGWLWIPKGGMIPFITELLDNHVGQAIGKMDVQNIIIPVVLRKEWVEKKNDRITGRLLVRVTDKAPRKVLPKHLVGITRKEYGNPQDMAKAVNSLLRNVNKWIKEDEAQSADGFTEPTKTSLRSLLPRSMRKTLEQVTIDCAVSCGFILILTEDEGRRYRLMRNNVSVDEMTRILKFHFKHSRWPAIDEWMLDGEELAQYLLVVERVQVHAFGRAFKILFAAASARNREKMLKVFPDEMHDHVLAMLTEP